jgi:hypothetical protein
VNLGENPPVRVRIGVSFAVVRHNAFKDLSEREDSTLAKSESTPTVEEKPAAASEAQQPARPAAQQQQTEVVVDEAGAHAAYANFARVTATPEEVIVDFALNPQPFAVGRQDVKVSQRLIMNFYTAKRLLGALQMTIQRHESAFGAIELDVRRRANIPPAATAAR